MPTATRISARKLFRGTLLIVAAAIMLQACQLQRVHIPPVEEPIIERPAGALQIKAEQALQQGEYGRAEMFLERALRVDPRNARLWHIMGQVKYGQGDFDQTVQFCLKSNSLAGKNEALVEENLRLMEKAYIKMGKTDKAEQVRRRYMYKYGM